MVWIAALGVAVTAAVVMGALVPRVRIDDDPEAPDFATLVSPRSVAGVGLAAFVVAQVLWVVPEPHWWLWVPYLGIGGAMAYVDLRTTFLPRMLHYVGVAAMGAGLVVLALIDGWAALGAVIGALGAFALLYLAWRLSPGLGFGDVRLAVLIGGVAGQAGASMWGLSLFLGTALGAVHAVGHALWARRDPERPRYFPYGPALWLGPVAAAAWTGLG
jgi:leader peptidase (prepilin peptidase)/N-methyltransferase